MLVPVAAQAEPGPPPPAAHTAFHYGAHPPIASLRAFDRVVLEPDHVSATDLADLAEGAVEVFAYLSVGEAHAGRPWFGRLGEDWKLGKRTAWGGVVMDPLSEGWRAFLLEQCRALWARGFRGFFLDTLDSYEGVLETRAERARRDQALLTWLRSVHAALPGVKLIFNRGFSLFPAAAPLASAVVAESLFSAYDPARDRYVEVAEADRTWLRSKLSELQRRHGLPITVIDYVAPGDRARAREIARRIMDLGFSPYVASGALDRLGVGAFEVLPRRVLMVYDSREADLAHSDAHRLLAMPLEHLGYAVDYMDAAGPLREGHLGDIYAGIVSWFTDGELAAPHVYRAWLSRQIADGVRVAVVGSFGIPVDHAFLAPLGLEAVEDVPRPPLQIVRRDEVLDFEAQAVPLARGLLFLRSRQTATRVHLELRDARGAALHPVLTAAWGGVALAPFVLEMGEGERIRWIINPFAFFERALALPPVPALDVTTENGRRLLTAHIDGDGFLNVAERPRRPLAAEVLLTEILRRFSIPTTVSVIEGEVGPAGLYAKQSPRLEAIARTIFRLDHVEAATHTFSHPFDWHAAESGHGPQQHEAAHLPIPGYKYDPRREIGGSAGYIDGHLLPKGKRTRLVLWSGSALPGPSALAAAREAGVGNVNGGSTVVDFQTRGSLTEVTCLARPVGPYRQVYAPAPNENDFTNLWRGPFYGYRNVVELFKLTGSPRRLKPISIYYHFYSAAKPAGMAALREVHEWALEQDVFPTFLSDYALKVGDFYRATLARTGDGGFRFRGLRALRTVRFDARLGWPDLAASPDVVQTGEVPQGRYASFRPGDVVEMRFGPEPPGLPHLGWANARVTAWQRQGRGLSFSLSGGVPARAAIARCTNPRVTTNGRKTPIRQQDGLSLVAFAGKESGRVVVSCQ